MPSDAFAAAAFNTLQAVRLKRPLIHNITNYVAMTLSANVLLSLGASPAMVHSWEEVQDFALLSDALVINIGTLSAHWVDSMELAAKTMNEAKKPWVLDPVGAGATPYRTQTAQRLLALHPAVVRGNADEIRALAGSLDTPTRGVDAQGSSEEALAAALALARACRVVVAVTGKTDFITDGSRTLALTGGDALMTRSTAIGCSLTAVVGACCAVANPFEAACHGLAVYATAGQMAAEKCSDGPGFLPHYLCNALSQLSLDDLLTRTHSRDI